jgi:carbonic anhydrase
MTDTKPTVVIKDQSESNLEKAKRSYDAYVQVTVHVHVQDIIATSKEEALEKASGLKVVGILFEDKDGTVHDQDAMDIEDSFVSSEYGLTAKKWDDPAITSIDGEPV